MKKVIAEIRQVINRHHSCVKNLIIQIGEEKQVFEISQQGKVKYQTRYKQQFPHSPFFKFPEPQTDEKVSYGREQQE
jgi:hypothetical protein